VRLALLLRQRLNHDAAAIAALRAEIQGNADSVANLDRFDRWMRKIPCPLLKDNLCSVYETRPIVCRSFFVTTPWQNCYVPNAKSSSPSEPQHVGMMIGLAVDTVLHERGLQVAQGEIAAMLAAALAPGAVEHWISGAPVFPADPTYLEVLASVHEQFAGE
jgi:Fe-S-cluster containining protein